MFKVSVFGLGYVGCVSAGCLARLGHRVVGVDVNPDKVALINAGKPTIVEADVSELIATQRSAGRLSATTDVAEALDGCDISLVCVGTPSDAAGRPDMTAVMHVAGQIGSALAAAPKGERPGPHVIAIRSTSPPGTAVAVAEAVSRAAPSLRAGEDFAVAVNPEFLREGSSVADYFHPQYTLLGADCPAALAILRELYTDIDAPVKECPARTAEFIKYASNTFHALKVVFANEIAAVCRAFGVDSHQVMDLLCADTRLNISPAYLKPGFAFGGSCLPKDLRALNSFARERGIELPVMASVARSNELHIVRAVEMAMATGCKKIGVLGLAFKDGTDDLRESPVVELLERLLGKGRELWIHDANVSLTRIMGANRRYIDEKFPHLVEHMTDSLDELAARCELVIVTQRGQVYRDFVRSVLATHRVIDLVRIVDAPPKTDNYLGIGW